MPCDSAVEVASLGKVRDLESLVGVERQAAGLHKLEEAGALLIGLRVKTGG